MPLALFDLDHTLLCGDSNLLLVEFLVRLGRLDAREHERAQALAEQYDAGTVVLDAASSMPPP